MDDYLDTLDSYKREASELRSALLEEYDKIFRSNDFSWRVRFVHMLGVRLGFNEWMGFVVGFRETSSVTNQALYMIFDAQESSGDFDGEFFNELARQSGDGVFYRMFTIMKCNKKLRECFKDAYSSGSGGVLEARCLVLLLGGVNEGKVGLEGVMECVAAGVGVSQVEEFLSLNYSYRSAFYSF